MDTLKKHLPFSGQEGLQELKKIAERFEEKIYTAATSQVHPYFLVFLPLVPVLAFPDDIYTNTCIPGNSFNAVCVLASLRKDLGL